MKQQMTLIIVLAVTVIVLGAKLAMTKSSGDVNAEDAVLQNIAARVSVRAYDQKKPVEKEKVEKLLRAGMAAPSAMNKQPWHFVVVDDRGLLDELGERFPNAKAVKTAPLAIVVCGDTERFIEGKGRNFWVQDCSAATQNILIAARSMGLGSLWTGFWPDEERVRKLAELLAMPENIIPMCVIVVGYPAEQLQPKDKYKEENVSYNGYDTMAAKKKAAEAAAGRELKPYDVVSAMRDNPFRYFTGDGLLLCAGDKNGSNAMTIGWGALGMVWQKPLLSVFVRENRYTDKFIKKSEYFTVMHFSDKEVLKYMGTKSGRDGDKAKVLGLTVAYTENGAPYYKEADEVIECRTMAAALLDEKTFRSEVPANFYKARNADDPTRHMEYLGEVVGGLKK